MNFTCLLCQQSESTFLFEKRGLRYYRCRACGHVQLFPLPQLDECHDFYEESDHYATNLSRQKRLGLDRGVVAQLQKLGASGPVLDVGAGAGTFLEASEEQGWSGTAIELSKPNTAHIRQHTSAEIIEVPIEEAELPDGRFGLVVFSHSLEHIRNPVDTLRRASQALRPDGILHIAVPNFGATKRILGAGKFIGWIYEHHLSYFDKTTLTWGLRASGFEPLAWSHDSFDEDYAFAVGFLMRWKLERPLTKFLGATGRSLEELLANPTLVNCPPWRAKLVSKITRAVMRGWPDRLSEWLGRGDEIRVTAKKRTT